jgi:hypothetical protein
MNSPDIDSSNPQPEDDSTGSGGRDRLADVGREAASGAKRKAESLYRDASGRAAAAAGETSEAIDRAASALGESGHETLSHATAALSDKVRSFSEYLEDRSLDQLLGDARQLAQRNPGLFIAGGVALGFALSRFFKASAGESHTGQRFS